MIVGVMGINVEVFEAGESEVNGAYAQQDPTIIPAGFRATCVEMGWPTEAMWDKLNDFSRPWFLHENGVCSSYRVAFHTVHSSTHFHET